MPTRTGRRSSPTSSGSVVTDFTLDMDALDAAFVAARDVLAGADPEDSELTVAITMTLAVVPHILREVAQATADANANARAARAECMEVRRELRGVAERSRAQHERLMLVFEEIDDDAVAHQILGQISKLTPIGRRDEVLVRTAVRHTIVAVGQAVTLSLSTDPDFPGL